MPENFENEENDSEKHHSEMESEHSEEHSEDVESFHNMANKSTDGGPQGYVSFNSRSEMISSTPNGEMESFHNLANKSLDNGPEGYNYTNDCTNLCSSETEGNTQCNSVATFKPELNAQGMNCPMGYSGKRCGSNF